MLRCLASTQSARLLLGALLTLTLSVLTHSAHAAQSSDDFLEPEEAFKFSAVQTSPSNVRVKYVIAPGYYMYRERFEFSTDQPAVTVGSAKLPKGKLKHDKVFNKTMQIYRGQLSFDVPVANLTAAKAQAHLMVKSQGCADKGLCFPPIEDKLALSTNPVSAASPAGNKLIKP